MAGVGVISQLLDLTKVFRTAYIELVMKSDSLQVQARILETGYDR